ncbi:MAG: hypothetical protein AUK28_11235 [Desulfobacterales bacterium CG2_30_60_27]|nr:MAG: hypothetical protein AUK28_11235 [Desulfobacterales bacterium CG2_30_60_27]
MTPPPAQPKIYHITHIENLPSIVAGGCIESDGRRFRQGGGHTSIGMTEIKRRRLFENDVPCHTGTKVGDYVPFYFCPKSIMLFIIYKDNHPDMAYHGGQRPIIHLQLDLETAIRWADTNGVLWSFSDRNAGTRFTSFYKSREDLDKIEWEAVRETDFREPQVKEGKQAEFLIHDVCPWHLVEKVGVLDEEMRVEVNNLLQQVQHKPIVSVERAWYY